MQPTFFSSIHLTVSQLTFHIRKQLENDPTLQDVWVEGEISNLSRPASGHIYFTLKDKNASLRCMMWKPDAARLRLNLQDGMAIEAHGRITVYEPQGTYQLAVNLIQPKGEGALYQEFLRLKAMLEAEGLFDVERKRPIPELPRMIGIVTSGTGAALRDMLNTLRRRLPLAQVILAPSPVQGVEAPPALVNALCNFSTTNIQMSSCSRAAVVPSKTCGLSTMSGSCALLRIQKRLSFAAWVTKPISPSVILPQICVPRPRLPPQNLPLKPQWMICKTCLFLTPPASLLRL